MYDWRVTVMRYVTVAVLLVCGGLALALWWQSTAVDNLKAENALLGRNAAVLTAQVEQARLSAEVAAARAVREQRMNVAAQGQIEAIRKIKLGDCADALLDPDLSSFFNRLRNAD